MLNVIVLFASGCQKDFNKVEHDSLIKGIFETIDLMQGFIKAQQLPMHIKAMAISEEPVAKQLGHYKFNQKYYDSLQQAYADPLFIMDSNATLSLFCDGIRVKPDWQKLQRRIVTAGRKSELILQASKLNAEHTALDATAGFGHDSLILASTGAQVTMLEQNPLLVLMLLVEQYKMQRMTNWQKLMSRITIYYAQAENYLNSLVQYAAYDRLNTKFSNYDVVYLDPMFPNGSYASQQTGKGAKVGKQMQALRGLIDPPNTEVETQLFKQAQAALVALRNLDRLDRSVKQDTAEVHQDSDKGYKISHASRRLIIKRSVTAPNLANQPPDEVWQNNVVRFDGYFI